MSRPEDPPPPVPGPGAPEDHGLPALAPDIVEQEDGDILLDNIVPTRGYEMVPVVGLGGSAGGLAALQAFFSEMPADSGMVFVVIMHLAAEHESILAELLQRTTRMPVRQVQGRVKVEPDHVYVIPPAKHLSMADGHLILSEPARAPGKHVAVDLFFRTLADTHGPHAAAVVLSGADGDGAIGIKRIKERGGLTVAQDPREAEHDSMPRSAIATNMVDWVLPVADMPRRLVTYWQTERRLRLPPEEGPLPAARDDAPHPPAAADPDGERALQDILVFLRTRTGRDFTYYKRATVVRRIGRRMQINEIADPEEYLAFLRTHPGEAGALLQDLLISVTNFFRDRESFAALAAEMPRLFHGKGPHDAVRVWVTACATGEEAYSVAILLCEYAATLPQTPVIQVFATDLDDHAIQIARAGVYPETIAADVSEERLARFFSRDRGAYRVSREVREIVLFALHDLLKDSPFSRLDLITCRNLLIYFNREAKRRVWEIFHFALGARGLLFLGSSESVEESNALFEETDKKHRLYVRCPVPRVPLPSLAGPSAALHHVLHQGADHPVVPSVRLPAPVPAAGPGRPGAAAGGSPSSWSELHFRLMERFGPPSVVVDREHHIVHLGGYAGRFLQLDNGEPTPNLLRLIHPMLRQELRAALFQAAHAGEAMDVRGLPVDIEGTRRFVDITVAPAQDLAPGFLLVIFEEKEPASIAVAMTAVSDVRTEPMMRHLERELEETKARLHDTVEQADASNEEMKASNEELQSINEELRSATEELETGREELQSINEELSTVNQELKSKVDELARSNGDLQNLMAATQIATVFLDRTLSIQRYTPPAVALFNLIPTDVGRPISDLTPRLEYPALHADAERVLMDLAVVEVEVPHADGRTFLARMLPYRTPDDHIAGVVMTFVDVARRRRAEDERWVSEARFRVVADLVPDLLFSTDAQGELFWCNQRWLAYTGQVLPEVQGGGWAQAIHPEDRERVRRSFLEAVREGHPSYRSEHRLIGANGQARRFLVRAEPLRDETGKIIQWFGVKTDVEDFRRAEKELTASQELLRLIIENAREFAIFSTDRERGVTSWNPGAERMLGYSEREILGRSADNIFTPEDRAAGAPQRESQNALDHGRAADERWHQRKDGSRFWANGALMRMNDAGGEAIGFVKILRDETEARETRQALEQGREDLWAALKETEQARAAAEAAAKAKDHFLAVLSHELRTPLTPVMMAVHLLARNDDLPESAREALDMIRRNVQIEAHFIDDLLDITRITRGKLEVVREPTDLHEAVRRAVEVSTADIEAKGQRLTVALDAGEHALRGDATRLQQVFWNLLKNASKFTPEGGAVAVRSRNEPGRVVVEVSDTGIGFEAAEAARIFEAFEQASAAVTREFGGLGLGLAISKATVDAHGGVLRAQSAGRGQGATFTVELPLSA